MKSSDANVIRIKGARQNNLKNLSLDLPLNELIVLTGVSGSGKSSLAFDTVYAEGQRRYTETFSPYTRQFLERMDKPQVDEIQGIPPSIAVNQANSVRTSRSTVGTITEIADYLKMLFPRMAELRSPETGRVIKPWTVQEIAEEISKTFTGQNLQIHFTVPFPSGTKWKEIASFLQAQGFLRVWIKEKVIRLDVKKAPKMSPDGKDGKCSVEVIQDRLRVEQGSRARLLEGLQTALRFGKGIVTILPVERGGEVLKFASRWICPYTRREFQPASPSLFAFNNPVGACPVCNGFGRIIEIDYSLALPDQGLSIARGVVKPFQTEANKECQRDLLRACKRYGIPTDVPFHELSQEQQQCVLLGRDEWYGVKGFFDWLESRTYKMHVRILLSRYRAYRTCPKCQGSRFKEELGHWRLAGKTLMEINRLPLGECRDFFDTLEPSEKSSEILIEQIRSRLRFLNEVGLGYLTLDRATRTLSGGEVQRVNLTTCLGASLVQTLFVLDEPSIGLHSRDTAQMIGVLQRLRDRGNTVLVVEHDESVIRAADTVIELGPGRGSDGGERMYQGTVPKMLKAPRSLTGQYLSGRKRIALPEERRSVEGRGVRWLDFRGATQNNLRNLDFRIPLDRFVVISGVSGSGKSTLVHEVVHKHLQLKLHHPVHEPAKLKGLKGAEAVREAVLVDQTPLSQTPRSTPALYIGAYDDIRSLFAMSEAARQTGLNPSFFSFNSGAGRCERCTGTGYEKVTMQFLSDLFVSCPACEGKRFQKHVLQVEYRGKNIDEVLNLTIDQALDFFSPEAAEPGSKDAALHRSIHEKLLIIRQVGLGYLKLGQPINNLSGGEAQRLKLVGHLTQGKKRTRAAKDSSQESLKTKVLILDEPTTGLHFDDIRVLLQVLQNLVEQGHSLIIVEHNLDVMKHADWILELGPEAGDKGGLVIGEGSPERICKLKTPTADFLRPCLESSSGGVRAAKQGRTAVAKKKRDAQSICIHGARHHNLKNIDVEIPRDQMVVVTGLSGSGKSTLAFDLLFAEGQRRYLDCLNTYARQFMEQLEKPAVDAITGIPPAVAIEQRTTRGGRKSTVATVTEIYHFLRLLYAKLGSQHDPQTDEPAIRLSTAEVLEHVREKLRQEANQELSLLAPLVKGRKGFHTEIAKWADKKGYPYLRADGKWIEPGKFKALDRYREHNVDLVLGNVSLDSEDLAGKVADALHYGKGTFYAWSNSGEETLFSTSLYCPGTGRSFDELDPRLFSYNSPHGWCRECFGYGTIVPVKLTAETDIEREQEMDLARETAEEGEPVICPVCEGSRLNDQARAVRFSGLPVPEINAMTVAGLRRFLSGLKLDGRDAVIARDILPEIVQRLTFLERVGLEYLNLNRSAPTLSGGESQRIRLAAQLGSNLRGVLYVLDEPTIGLHPRDNEDLIKTLKALRDRGNSLVIVEHDEDTMRASDRIIDLGPGAGVNGGEIMAQGSWKEISKQTRSVTGALLGNPLRHPLKGERRPIDRSVEYCRVAGATANNLKDLDVAIPLKRLTVVSGVSGSGKSTLMHEILWRAAENHLTGKRKPSAGSPFPWTRVSGFGCFKKVMEVDQSPIGKTSRSTVATYIGLMDHLRKLFSQLKEAKIQGLTPTHFSYNAGAGRCQQCAGQGFIKVEMNFLPAAYVPCEACGGKRWIDSILEITYKGKTIYDILEMSIEEALPFFESHLEMHTILDLIFKTGMHYLKLGQTSPTLSGGEAQRLKLVAELAEAAKLQRRGRLSAVHFKPDHYLYLLEEPTVGLHLADVKRLLEILHQLVDAGHTVIVVEHHLDVIAEADYVIDLGPEGGNKGGRIVASGPPEKVARSKKSYTAKYLKTVL